MNLLTLSHLKKYYEVLDVSALYRKIPGPVVQTIDNAHYPVDKCLQNKLHNPLDSDLSSL